MKKKVLLGALCVGALLSLAACGGNNDKPQTPADKPNGNTETDKTYTDIGTEINIWATEKEQEVIQAVVDEYNADKKTDSEKFKYKFTAVSEADCGTTLAKDPTLDGAPALFLTADDHIYNLASKTIVSEIKGKYLENIKKQNTDVSIVGATYDNKVYGFPVTSDNGYFLWYNNSALKGEAVTSLEELLKTAKAAGKTVGFEINNGWYANSFIMSPQACGTKSLTWARGETGVKYTTTWDNEVGVKVSEYIADLIAPYYADGTLVTATNETIISGFQEDKMIAAVSGTWMEADLKKHCATLDATKLPSYHIDGKAYQMASFTGSKLYCLNKTRPVAEQKAAAALADLLTSKKAQLTRFEKRATIPSNKEALADSKYTANVSMGAKALAEQNKFACVQSQTAQDRYWDIGKAIGQAYLDKNLGDYTTWADFLKAQMDILRKEA